MYETDATYSELQSYQSVFFVPGVKVSRQKENERERIKKGKIDEGKEGRKENNGRNAREEDLNKLHRNEMY